MLGFTFITDSKLSMYREKAIKSENLAKEIEEMQDKADFYKERLSELKSDIASKDKEILSIGKDLSESKEKIDALKENQKKLIKSVKKKTEELDAAKADLDKAKSDLDEANYKISNLEEKKNSISYEKMESKTCRGLSPGMVMQKRRLLCNITAPEIINRLPAPLLVAFYYENYLYFIFFLSQTFKNFLII